MALYMHSPSPTLSFGPKVTKPTVAPFAETWSLVWQTAGTLQEPAQQVLLLVLNWRCYPLAFWLQLPPEGGEVPQVHRLDSLVQEWQ